MDNVNAAVIFIIAVILFIVFTILASQVPKLSEGNVSAVLMWIGIITLLAGMIIHFSVTQLVPGDTTTMLYLLSFVTHVFLFPLSLFAALAGAASVHDAKKSLLSS